MQECRIFSPYLLGFLYSKGVYIMLEHQELTEKIIYAAIKVRKMMEWKLENTALIYSLKI